MRFIIWCLKVDHIKGVGLQRSIEIFMLTAGVDEVGRGSLAGDVFAAAVILHPDKMIDGLKDSKKISKKRREELDQEIKDSALCFAIAKASVEEIDSINILQASLLAMTRAVYNLNIEPEFVLVDGNHIPSWDYSAESIVRGDTKIPEIAAASIIAKVSRDAEMVQKDFVFPEYGFSRNKGYPTSLHLTALSQFGPCAIHRRSFTPVSRLLG